MSELSRDVVISIRDLVITYPTMTAAWSACSMALRLTCMPGETLVIMGGSGCGKSTLLNCLIGELRPSQGQILYRIAFAAPSCVTCCDMDEQALNTLRKRIGILFQSGALFNSMTVAENVALPLRSTRTSILRSSTSW